MSASAITPPADPFSPQPTPRALSEKDILEIIRAFGEATRRAISAGLDGVELHGAHGFLIQNFLSPYFNRREDDWGGNAENRQRFALAVIDEVMQTIKTHATRPFLLGMRLSPEESVAGGLRLGDYYPLVEALIAKGIDYLYLSPPPRAFNHAPEKPNHYAIFARKSRRTRACDCHWRMRTPPQARKAFHLGLAVVAIGQSLITESNGVALARKSASRERN